MAIYTRMQQKHDIEANWIKAKNFIPLEGEIIIYEIDDNYDYQRIKIGDGVRYIKDLPFVAAQGDWAQSDAAAVDYIKNKTHYHINNIVSESLEFKNDYNIGCTFYSDESSISNIVELVGKEFFIKIDDAYYNDTLKIFDDGVSVFYYLGNWKNFLAGDISQFAANFSTNETGNLTTITLVLPEFSNHDTVQVTIGYSKQELKQLDEKFIPDTIAKVVDIKNGTYFTEAEKYDILVDTTTINVEAEDFYYRTTQSPFTAQIIDGNKYLVIFDEVSYICYGRKYNKMNDTLNNSFDYCLIGDVVFNNGNYSRPISGSNLPFCIVNDYFENTNDFTADVLVFGDTASTHTIKIVDVTPTVKKLPEEFLADNFKAVTKGFGEKSAIFGLGQEASGAMSIAAGQSTVASGWMSIALGLASKASGAAALTLGQLAEASGTLAVAHGFNTKASGAAAVAAGDGTIAGSECQLVHGKFNIEDTADTYAHIVGGGENNMNRKNIYALDWTGNASFAGQVAASSIKIGNTTFTEAQLTKILKFIESIEEVNN